MSSTLVFERYVVGQSVINALESLFRYSDSGIATGVGTSTVVSVYTGVYAPTFETWAFPTGVDGYGKALASTASGQAQPLLVDNYNRFDAPTIVGLATASVVEIHGMVDTSLVVMPGVITYTYQVTFVNSATITGQGTGTATEIYTVVHRYVDAATETGQSVITDAQQILYSEIKTVSGTAVVLSTNTHNYITETPIVSGTATISSVNSTDFIAGGVAVGEASPSDVSLYGGLLAAVFIGTAIPGRSSSEDSTVTGQAVISGPDNYNFKDAVTVSGVAVIAVAEIPALDLSTIDGFGHITFKEVRNFGDQPLEVGVAVPLTTFEGIIHSEAATVVGQSVITEVQQMNALDANTVTGTGVEIGVFVFGGYEIGQYEVSLYGEATGFDADIVTGTNVISITEVYP